MECKHCNAIMDSRGDKLQKPTLEKCRKISQQAKDDALDYVEEEPFYVADKALYEAAHNPGISFTELLLGDREQGVCSGS